MYTKHERLPESQTRFYFPVKLGAQLSTTNSLTPNDLLRRREHSNLRFLERERERSADNAHLCFTATVQWFSIINFINTFVRRKISFFTHTYYKRKIYILKNFLSTNIYHILIKR